MRHSDKSQGVLLHSDEEKYIYNSIACKIYGADKSRPQLTDFQRKNTTTTIFITSVCLSLL
jgi:hypothetical protein